VLLIYTTILFFSIKRNKAGRESFEHEFLFIVNANIGIDFLFKCLQMFHDSVEISSKLNVILVARTVSRQAKFSAVLAEEHAGDELFALELLSIFASNGTRLAVQRLHTPPSEDQSGSWLSKAFTFSSFLVHDCQTG
jgi:hypothetical protein